MAAGKVAAQAEERNKIIIIIHNCLMECQNVQRMSLLNWQLSEGPWHLLAGNEDLQVTICSRLCPAN